MIDIRIICTHDAVKLAEKLERVLTAQQHRVVVCYGRQSLEHVAASREAKEAAILIWSFDAPSALYMLQWLESVDPTRLVEIARAPGAPPLKGRRAKVIDFSAWNGERGGPAWRALVERLQTVQDILDPPRIMAKRTTMASLVGAMAATLAMFFHFGKAPEVPVALAEGDDAPGLIEADVGGLGGPLSAIEPASADDIDFTNFGPAVPLLETGPEPTLTDIPPYEPAEIREASFLTRLAQFNPLRRDDDER